MLRDPASVLEPNTLVEAAQVTKLPDEAPDR